MDHTLSPYLDILESVLHEWGQTSSLLEDVETDIVRDREGGSYMLISTGWNGRTRIHSLAFHARVREGQIWIEWDGSDPSITEELVRRGIPRDKLVYGWQSPSLRAQLAALPVT